MTSKDIGWEHGKPVGGNRKIVRCNYCGKVMHGGITRLKAHVGHVTGQVVPCPRVAREVTDVMKMHLKAGNLGAGTSKPMTSENKRVLSRNFSVRQADEMTSKGIDSHMFPSKQKSVKSMFAAKNIKRVGKAISKFFHFNAIPFHAADNPYYQSMIDEIAKVGSGIKGPSAYQIGNEYLDEEFEELEKYLGDIYDKFSTFGCTLMCDGWSTRTKHPIINFMVYCDRHMIYHSSVDCTNVKKIAQYIFKLMDEVVEAVGEKNVVQVVTDSESSMKAAGQLLMKKRQNLFWSPCAAHCIDLMLKDIGKIDNVKETIA
nr:uncharacterized protein LOC113711200 [Coffea arabica]